MNIPNSVKITVALNNVIKMNKCKLSPEVIKDSEELIEIQDFKTAEKLLAKFNVLSPRDIHPLIRDGKY
jgi:hypothetical protein